MLPVLLILFPLAASVAITVTQISTVVPQLLDHSVQLEESLNSYRVAQIQIAAAKLKSLLPNEVGKSVSADELSKSDENSDGSDNSDSDDDQQDIPTSSILLQNSFNSLLKSLKDADLASELRSFDQTRQSLADFVASKEQEAAQNLLESVVAIRQIQGALQIVATDSLEPSAKLIARLVDKLDTLSDEYDDLETLQKRLSSTKKPEKVRKELANSQAKIVKIVNKIATLIE